MYLNYLLLIVASFSGAIAVLVAKIDLAPNERSVSKKKENIKLLVC
jgi:hypothetical protein